MSAIRASVIHLVGADTSAEKLDVLRSLRGRLEAAFRQSIVQIGDGALQGDLPAARTRVRPPFGIGWLGAAALAKTIDSAQHTIIHVWSARVLASVAPHAASASRARDDADRSLSVLIETDVSDDLQRLARWPTSTGRERNAGFACPTALAQRRLLEGGVRSENAVLIRESVDFGALNRAERADVRAQLDLADSDSVILVLPPIARAGGTFIALWAALVLEKVRPGVRVVVPGEGREVRRLDRLVESARHAHVVRFDEGRFSLSELLAAADLATFLPAGNTPVSGLMWAMAAGVPIVATAVPATAELLAHGLNAWLCRPDDPKGGARRMLQALEQPEESRRRAETARGQAFKVFGRQRLLEQYACAYRNVIAERPLGEGILDPALAS